MKILKIASLLIDEVEPLKAMLDEFVNNIIVHFKDIVIDLAIRENNHHNSLKSALDDVRIFRRLICTEAFSSNQAEGHAKESKSLNLNPLVACRNAKELKNFIWNM